MSTDLVDRIYIDISDRNSGWRLTRRLGEARMTALLGVPPCLVVATFESGADLARLLREVESWVEDESLCAVRFLLDDRIYVLGAGEADWTAHPWQGRAA